jgi:Ca2+-binding RTX toxin-like protein
LQVASSTGSAARFTAAQDGSDVVLTALSGDAVTLLNLDLDEITASNVECADGSVLFFGDSGHDTKAGTDDDDQLQGPGGEDNLNGGEGNDKVVTGAGNDVLSFLGGKNSIAAGEGSDLISLGTGIDILVYITTSYSTLLALYTVENLTFDGTAGEDRFIISGAGTLTFKGAFESAQDLEDVTASHVNSLVSFTGSDTNTAYAIIETDDGGVLLVVDNNANGTFANDE